MLKINVEKNIIIIFVWYAMYDLFREKNICYVKIMLGRGLTDYGKSMALRSMEYWYQWISGNKSFIFRILFSAQFQIAHIYILIIFGHQTLMYICYRANLDGFFLDGRILLNRFCFDIRAFPSFIELRIYRKIAKNWTQSEFYGGKIADFYTSLKEIGKARRFLLLVSSSWKWENIQKETSDYRMIP